MTDKSKEGKRSLKGKEEEEGEEELSRYKGEAIGAG